MRIAPEAIRFLWQSFSARRLPTSTSAERESAGLLPDAPSVGNLRPIRIPSELTLRGPIRPITARKEGSPRRWKALTDQQICFLLIARRVKRELPLEFRRQFASAFTLFVDHDVASQSLSWRPPREARRVHVEGPPRQEGGTAS